MLWQQCIMRNIKRWLRRLWVLSPLKLISYVAVCYWYSNAMLLPDAACKCTHRADRTLGIVMKIYCSYTVCALLKQLFTLQQQMWWYTDLSYEEISFFISNLGWVGTLSSSFLWENNVFWFSLWYPLTALPQLKSFLSGDDNLCGSVGSECKMLGVQAGRDVIFDVLQNQLLNTLCQDWGECHREVIVSLSGHTDKTMHSWNWWKHSDVTMMSAKIAVGLMIWF